MDLAASIYLSEAPFPPRFLFGVLKQFCMFGIWSNTQCKTPVDALYKTPYYTLYKYIPLYLFTQGREGGGGGKVNQ
jgi:hypothetical protein